MLPALLFAFMLDGPEPVPCNRLVRIPPGCIEVRCDYRVVHTGGRVDFWFGYIEPADGRWRVNWSAGTVVRLLDGSATNQVISIETETLDGETIKIGRVRHKETDLTVLDSGWIQFSVGADQPKGSELLRSLARNYRLSVDVDCEAPASEVEAEPSN